MQKLTDLNRLSITNPELCEEWNFKRNVKDPNEYHSFSNKKVWWKCKNGHEWEASISKRSFSKRGCPYCSNNQACSDNCLSTTHPFLLKEWDYTKNKISPFNITSGSDMRVWWKCQNGHSWDCNLYTRTREEYRVTSASKNKSREKVVKPTGCPYCTGQKVCDDNSFSTMFPEVSKEWHPTKNNGLSPSDFTFCSGKRAWWKCQNGHEWTAIINTRRFYGCPTCNQILLKDGTRCGSMVEAYVYLKMKGLGVNMEHNGKYGGQNKNGTASRKRFDFYLPSVSTYVEVTSFSKKMSIYSAGMWFRYLRNIVEKKHYVERVLGKNFRFIQKTLRPFQIEMVRRNMAVQTS